MSENDIKQYLYYGSNEWLYQFKTFLDNYIEERKSYTHEIFFVIECVDSQNEYKSIIYTSDPSTVLKKEGPKILALTDINYKLYRVYLRRFADNYTILLAIKKEKSLIEVTLDYFKLLG